MGRKRAERSLLAPVALVMAAAMSACGALGPTPIVFDEPLPDDPGPDVGGRALRAEIFADGRVTTAEYERAYTKALECMRDEGFDVQGPIAYGSERGYTVVAPGWDSRLWLTSSGVPVESDGVDRYGPVNARCQAQWSYAVEQMYLKPFEPTEEETQAWLERAWACMRENGQPINDPPTLQDATASVSHGCEPWLVDDDPAT